jgi:hypothetical protein
MATIHRVRRRWTGEYDLIGTVYDADGVAATATAGTVSIYDSAGTAIVTDGTCTPDSGTLTYALDVDTADELDTYECRWSATVSGETITFRTNFELVGEYLFEVSDLRTHSGGAFASTTDYPTDKLVDARTWVEQRMEKIAGVAFVPRGSREKHYGTGSNYLMCNQPRLRDLYSITENGTEWTAEQLAAVKVRGGILVLDSGAWDRDSVYVVHYEHGHFDTPSPVQEAGLILAAEYLIESNLRSRATSESTDVGFIRLSYAAEGRVGIPEVDGVLADYKERPVKIG